MSQIVDYGDPYMEMLSIFLRLLEKVIADSSWAAEVVLSDVVLVGVKNLPGCGHRGGGREPGGHNTMAD